MKQRREQLKQKSNKYSINIEACLGEILGGSFFISIINNAQ